jgi:hypothetical protein
MFLAVLSTVNPFQGWNMMKLQSYSFPRLLRRNHRSMTRKVRLWKGVWRNANSQTMGIYFYTVSSTHIEGIGNLFSRCAQWSLLETRCLNNATNVAEYTMNTLGLGNCLLSQTLLQPWNKRNAHGITSGAFLFCYREALCGNSLGELFGNSSGTLWEQGDIFNFAVLYIVQIR